MLRKSATRRSKAKTLMVVGYVFFNRLTFGWWWPRGVPFLIGLPHYLEGSTSTISVKQEGRRVAKGPH